jgi:hypothetical protein
LVDEGGGLAPEGVGEVIERGDPLGSAENGVGRVGVGVEEVVHAAEKTEKFVEPAFERMKLRRIAEMRFSDPAGRVAGGFEAVADGGLGKRQTDGWRRALGGAGVELVAEALLVTAGQKAGARRAAIGTADVTAREAHAVPRDAVEVGRGDFPSKALAAQFTVAEVVGDDDEDVGLALGGG